MDMPPVRYARTEDGVNVAYTIFGAGPLLIEMPISGHNNFNFLEAPAFANFYAELGQTFTVVAYDQRGFGRSQRGAVSVTLDSRLADLAAVVRTAELSSFTLFAPLDSAAAGVSYAVAWPEQVNSLVIWHGYLDGPRYRREAAYSAIQPLVSSQYDLYTVAAVANAHPPTKQDGDAIVRLALQLQDPHTKTAYMEANGTIVATNQAAELRVPTLVLHRADSSTPPLSFSEEAASLIPGALLRQLKGDSFLAGFGDINETVRAIADFVNADEAPQSEDTGAGSPFQTIMFTDLESFTALTQKLGDDAAQDVLHGHNDAVCKSLEEHGGREVKHTGDGIMAAFPSAVRAVEAALQIQRDLAGGEVRVRIGLNAGEPIAEDDDFYGTAVQLAARICDRAEPGQVLVSRVVADLCAGKKLSFQHHSDATLKGFDEPVALFEVGQ